ncbi:MULTISPECIES: MarR family winged helix-turn-helix transcriptional regulator [Mesonia]|uniref:Organic hydroperoxide resistance transcriptional regulator n=1 Tax=Mesonia oceanica TaxID=2687242 RepID=A0AC61YCC7_9FLAO|nr:MULTISPECIES: MarR family transcriptional regulator [Mesonia]MAN26991.1 MarR family transcriptional regulator [Mesonia sp.]VVV01900.1 Organic hydroperoxide resistance transcriptional regulator [Mesonia oceanica]|tara:strand:+ start:33039 stop:33479 length:441 start_codon:yes stop_codon:yes gene_type:complete
MSEKYEALKLDNQLCFPLYTASRLVIQRYQPMLKDLDITYPQYLVLMVLWEKDEVNLSTIAEKLQLQSNTLTPLLKRLQQRGFLERKRSETDERNIVITLTEKGKKLKDQACDVPGLLAEQIPLSMEEAKELYRLLYKMIGEMSEK